MVRAGARPEDYLRMPDDRVVGATAWPLPPLLIADEIGGTPSRQRFYRNSRHSVQHAERTIGAYRFFLNSDNPGTSLLVHFESQNMMKKDENARLYITPNLVSGEDYGSAGHLAAIQMAIYLSEAVGAPVVQDGSTFYAEAFDRQIGVVNGKVIGSDKWPQATASQIYMMLYSRLPLSLTGLSTAAIKLRNLSQHFVSDVEDSEMMDEVLALNGVVSRRSYMGGYQEAPEVSWDVQCGLDVSRTAAYIQSVTAAVARSKTAKNLAEKREKRRHQAAQSMKLIDDAVEVLMADIPDLRRIATAKLMLCPAVINERIFSSKLFKTGTSVLRAEDLERALLNLRVIREEQEAFLTPKKGKK
jgi:hypothetical protein